MMPEELGLRPSLPTAFSYVASGLAISSSLHLPELNSFQDPYVGSIGIESGKVPLELGESTSKGPLFELSPNRLLLRLQNVASYLVSDGTEILVDKAPRADDDSVRLFLLGPVFGALVHQRGLLPLHASAIETPSGAVLFAGPSGVGKSARAAMFSSRGYRVIADEVCVVHTDAGEITVHPSFPRLLLWSDVIERTGLWSPGVRLARPNVKKYHVPVHDRFARSATPVQAIYVVRIKFAGDYELIELSGATKVSTLLNITYRRQFLKGMNSEVRHFERVIRVANSTAMSMLVRPLTSKLLETADLLESDFTR